MLPQVPREEGNQNPSGGPEGVGAGLPLAEQAHSADPDIRQRAAHRVAASTAPEDSPLMYELLGDRDWRVRKTIVEGFVRRADDEVISGLIESLRDPENAGKRNSANEALIRIGAPAIPALLRSLATDPDVDVRLSVVNLLGDIQSPEAFEALLALCPREKDTNILSSVVSALGKYRDTRAVPPLLHTLKREDVWLRFHVVEALGEIGDRSALPAILPLYSEKALRKPVLEAIGKIADVGTLNFLLKVIGEDEKLNLTALRALIRLAETDKPRVIETAERHLIQKRFREAFPAGKVPALIEHLRSSPKREVRNFILKFLGWTSNALALPALLEALEQPESAETAAQALTDFGPGATAAVTDRLRTVREDETTALLIRIGQLVGGESMIAPLIGFLDHESPVIRRLAIEALGRTPSRATTGYLMAKLDDPDVACQQSAVNAVTALLTAFPEEKPLALGRLRKLLGSSSVPERLNALSILANVQGEGYPDELLLASKDGDPVIRQRALSLMGKFGEARFADQLVMALADESTVVRIAAIQALVKVRSRSALPPLVSALEDPDVWIRTAAAQALGEYREQEGIDALLRHLDADQPPVRIAVIEALGKAARPELVAVYRQLLTDEDVEIRKAALLALAGVPGEEGFDQLIESLSDPDWRMRGAAASALGGRGDHRALEPLHRTLLDDPDPFVQQASVVALDRFGSRESFDTLLRVLDRRAILDEVSELFIRHKETYRDLLEEAWRTAGSRQEIVIAAVLRAMKEEAGLGKEERRTQNDEFRI
ncbi:MAG TPA: HEAT repeat domain-containing protein [Thermoanaerobaculia bacterium]|nr:HEAT repeat domain-containing protein [Thermoanaerobaculia bacterium]